MTMNEKFEKTFFCAFVVAGLIGVFYGYSKFVEPYVIKEPADKIGAPADWATKPVEWPEPKFKKLRSTYEFRDRKSGMLDPDVFD